MQLSAWELSIRGDTSHYDLVCNESAKGIAQVELATGIPVLFGVITTENIEQAIGACRKQSRNIKAMTVHYLRSKWSI